jgi:hypothetical protein
VRRNVVIAACYLAAMAAWIYGVVEPSLGFGSDTAAAIGISALAAFHLAVGFAVGRGWTPLLALAVPLIAYPAGYADRGELLIWQRLVLAVPLGVLLIVAGVALRVVVNNRGLRPI